MPVTWSQKAGVAWRASLSGAGVSTPVVWRNQVYVTSQIGRGCAAHGNHPTLVQGAAAAESGERESDRRDGGRDGRLHHWRRTGGRTAAWPGSTRCRPRAAAGRPRQTQSGDAQPGHRRRRRDRLVRHGADRRARSCAASGCGRSISAGSTRRSIFNGATRARRCSYKDPSFSSAITARRHTCWRSTSEPARSGGRVDRPASLSRTARRWFSTGARGPEMI